jgi:starch synthase
VLGFSSNRNSCLIAYMEKKKVLIITQEMDPYTGLSELSDIASKLPKFLQSQQAEMRILMPRFGSINERRHRLHEVVRLSGMNIIVNDDDFPLQIKVASLPNSRQQVYFLDNEDFFRRKAVFEDAEGAAFEDNVERMVFFCKGAIETVRKFGWAPDIIHCMGWMTSLIPVYLRVAYKNEPLFQLSRIVYSMHTSPLDKLLDPTFGEKASINNLQTSDFAHFMSEGEMISLNAGAIAHSDGIILGSEPVDADVMSKLELADKPFLPSPAEDQVLKSYTEFYDSLLAAQMAD